MNKKPKRKQIKKQKKKQKINNIPPGLSTDDLEGTIDEIEKHDETIEDEINKAKGS